MTLYPSYLANVDSLSSKDQPAAPSTRSGDQSSIASRLANLTLSAPHKSASADSTHRAFFVTLHLLHSSLLPAESAASQSVAGRETIASSGPPSASAFLPALEEALSANRLTVPAERALSSETEGRPYSHHPDPHLDFLLRLRVALEANSYADLATNLLSLEAIPPPPPSVLAHLKELHLSSPSRQQEQFNPLATLLQTFVPRVRQNRIWPVVQRAYRFPPDPTEWLGSVLLFEFEVELEVLEDERARGEEEKVGGGARRVGQVAEDWDAEQVEDEAERGARGAAQRERVRTEAARRAAAWVVARK